MSYKLSSSTLNLFKECPKCFWLRFNKKIKRPDTIFPSLPAGMDKVLKEHFDKFRDNNKVPPEIKDVDAELFDDKELLEVWRNNRKGIEFKDKEGNILRGAVDNILKKGNKLIVLDYKTRGYALKEDTHEHYQDQMDIYNFLLRKNGYETEDYAYLIFYHPREINEKGEVIFNTDLIKMKVNIKNAEKLWKEALKTLKLSIPEPSEDCGFCKWVELCSLD